MTALAPRGERLAELLLSWFGRNGRTLPWRTDRSPYRVVVSEFMLQQTQVERVIPIFERFVATFPSFAALAAGSAGDVVRAWRGLGYNSRAVRLHALARAVCDRHGGELPREANALRALPGIGPYTCGAIRAFAFDCDELAFDVNVSRVLQRVLRGTWQPGSSHVREVSRAVECIVPRGSGNALNSALMDLGATLCTARAPKCLICPLSSCCKAVGGAAKATSAPRGRRGKRFEETTRYLRGRIVDVLRSLPPGGAISLLDLNAGLAALTPPRSAEEMVAASRSLARDGVVSFDGELISLDNT